MYAFDHVMVPDHTVGSTTINGAGYMLCYELIQYSNQVQSKDQNCPTSCPN
jgi:hypothetical protein